MSTRNDAYQIPPDQPGTDTGRSTAVPERQAAASIVRREIDDLYSGEAHKHKAHEKTSTRPRTNNSTSTSSAAWQKYQEELREYYQKYYENYYVDHMKKALSEKSAKTENTPPTSPKTTGVKAEPTVEPQIIYQGNRTNAAEAKVNDLRSKLLGNVSKNAKKLRKSRHFIPIMAASLVIIVFVFLQYNRVFIANVKAYVTPGSIDPQNIIVNPTANVKVGPEPKLIIPKINVDVPVHYGVGNDQKSQWKAMENGVAHFAIPGASSTPGQIGNTAIAGHSSNDLMDGGDYKFIFAQLHQLQKGDTAYANYKGKRYTYVVTKKEVVMPSEVNKLTYKTNKPILTLITCTPLGTAEKRLLVTLEQVSPDPTSARPAPSDSSGGSSTGSSNMAGNSPTFIERLFGSN